MKKIILILLSICIYIESAIITVGTGGTHEFMSLAATASSANDTIMLLSNVAHNNVRSDLKAGQKVFATSTTCTLFVGNTDGIKCTNNDTLYGFTIAYFDSAKSSFRYLINGDAITGVLLKKLTLSKNSGPATNRSGFMIGNNGGKGVITVDSCVIDSLPCGYLETGKVIKNSYFINCRSRINRYDSLYNCVLTLAGELALRGDSAYIGRNYVLNVTGEAVTLDEAASTLKGVVIEYNVVDSNAHVCYLLDGMIEGKFRFNRAVRATSSIVYTHNSEAKDSIGSCVFNNNSYWRRGVSAAYNILHLSNNLRSNKEMVFCGGGFGTLKSPVDTLDSLFTTSTVYSDSFQTFRDTFMVVDPFQHVTDSIYMFHKRGSHGIFANGLYAGWTKYLLNTKARTNETDNSFSAPCSVSNDYWFKNPIVGDSLWAILQDSTAGGSWTKKDSCIIRSNATGTNESGTLEAGKHYYRTISVSLSGYAVFDTTEIDSFVASGSCDSIHNLHIGDTTATTVELIYNLVCARDSNVVYYDADTTDSDSDSVVVYTADSLPEDEVHRIISGLPYSDSVWVWVRDSLYLSPKILARTADSTDTLYDTIPPDSFDIVVVQPTGGTITQDPVGTRLEVGTSVTWTLAADPHYHLPAAMWGDSLADSVDNPVTVSLTTDKLVSGMVYIDTFTLTEVPPTNGTITYSPNAGGSSPRYYPHNTRVTVTATADPGYVFRSLNGAISSTTPVDSFLMTDHLTISATFEALPTYLLSYDPGSGTGTPPAAPTEYDSTEIVTVLGNTGFTREGYVFSSWNTMPDGSGTRYLPGNTFEMTALTTLFAQWSLPTTEGRRKKGFIWSYKEQYRGF